MELSNQNKKELKEEKKEPIITLKEEKISKTKTIKKPIIITLIMVLIIGVIASIFILPSSINEEEIIEECQELLVKKEYQKAEEKLLKLNTKNAKTLINQIEIYKLLNDNDFDEALDLSEKTMEISIIYNTNDGELNEEKHVEYEFKSYPIASKEGYVFKKWDFIEYHMSLTKLEVVLSAQYTVKEYMITYNLYGGYFEVDPPTMYTVESEDILIPTPKEMVIYLKDR